MKKGRLLQLFSIITLAAAGVFGVVSNKSNKKVDTVEAAYDSRLYIVGNGTFGSWDTTKAVQLVSDGNSNIGKKLGLTISANTEFKIAYIENGSIQWGWDSYGSTSMDNKSYTFAEDLSGNIKIKYAGTYNIFLTNSYKVYMSRDLTITFNANSGSVSPASKTVTQEYNGATNKYGDLPTPTRTGFTFDGWYTSSSGGTQVTKDSSIYSLTNNQTLYAHWSPTVYTITYDRNKSNGLQARQSKNYGTNVTAYTPGTSPIHASGWDPSPYRRFLYWNTQYDGGGTNYNAGSTISANASFYLYYIEDWYNFRYRIDSGSWITLEHNDDGKGGGVTAQFAPSTSQSLPLNGFISFQYSSDGGSSWTNLGSVTFEDGCNYNTTTGIQLATVDKIYLKYLDSGSFSCYVPGISDRTICVFDTSSATGGGTPYTMRSNGDNETVTTVDVPIDKGQFVKRGYDGNYTFGSIFAGGTGNAALCFSQVGSETAVECTKTGVYTVYNQRGNYDNWKDVYFTRNEEASASLLAQKFNDVIEGICDDIVGGTKTLSNLQAVWGSNSSSTLYFHFNGQFSDTMNYFKTNASTSDAEILECVQRYDYIVKKYGTTALPDFLNRNNGYSANPQNSLIPTMLINNKESNSIVLIIVISLVSVSSIGAYFFLRRKREI